MAWPSPVALSSRFADTHARVGILPGWGLSQKLSRAIGIYRAKELSLTGNFLSAEQANDGFAQNFGDGLKTELKFSSERNKSVDSSAIEERRAGIQNRGKQQTS